MRNAGLEPNMHACGVVIIQNVNERGENVYGRLGVLRDKNAGKGCLKPFMDSLVMFVSTVGSQIREPYS